jgi:hypothetical protein
MTDSAQWFTAGCFAGISFSFAALSVYYYPWKKRHKKYRYFVSYRIFNNGIEERGGYRIVQSRQNPSEIDDAFFTAIGKAMGVQSPLEIQFTGCSRLA